MEPHVLFCPGPVRVSPGVKAALAAPDIGHREIEFSDLLGRVREKLDRVFGARTPGLYATAVLTGSGSAANEALIGSAAVRRRLLVLANGEFGERLYETARYHDVDVTAHMQRWAEPFALDRIEAAMASGRFDAVAWVHHETSTGMLNPLAEVAALAHRYRLDTFVDAVSSVGGLPIDIEAHGITFCTGTANKALAGLAGLAFVCGRRDAFDALAGVRARSMYLDLYRHYRDNDKRGQTPNTPAVNLFFALDAALDELLAQGLAHRCAELEALALRLRRGFSRLGLRPIIPEPLMSPLLTTLELPDGLTSAEFHERMKAAGYVVYAGKGVFHGRVFQVANLGALTTTHCDALLATLERICEDRS